MLGTTELTPSPLPAQAVAFSVAHQKLDLEIDFANKILKGRTEITIIPHSKEFKVIRLHCRQCTLNRTILCGKGPSMKYVEPYSQINIHDTSGVNQHHMIRKRAVGQLKMPPDETLTINLPKNLRIEELEPCALEGYNETLFSKLSGKVRDSQKKDKEADSSMASKVPPALTPAPKLPDEQHGPRFTPLSLIISFTVDNFRDGLHFVGFDEDDQRYPHLYSRNSPYPGPSSSIFPCVDDVQSRCTWEISIKCPRTLGDAFGTPTMALGSREPAPSGISNVAKQLHTNAPPTREIEDFYGFSEEEKALELAVVCSGDLSDDIPDPKDPAMKIVSFVCTTPVSPQHIGFAVGPFENVDLSVYRDADEDNKRGQYAVRVHGFCLPGRTDDVKNTCLPMAKAMDYFSLSYGSYPFSSYKMCFVDDLATDTVEAAALSICSNRLLYPENVIDPIDSVTRSLTLTLACQWAGIGIIPKDKADTWVTIGISHFLTDMFMRKLCGNNEYRFRQKSLADKLCKLDVNRPSLAVIGEMAMVDTSQLDFMGLKAPLVLFILDRRLAKASGSTGIARIISRIFLNAKVGDLSNNAITTAQFIRTCEKLGHTKLDAFFAQWVYGSGCPRFSVAQRFNKKKLVVEMILDQLPSAQPQNHKLVPEEFMRETKESMCEVPKSPSQFFFTGPMTIRIHEADGTPYEHIVEIKGANTKIDIPYNTKYKRLKRSRRQKERAAAAAGLEISSDAQDDILLYCLGDVLQSEEEIHNWRLSDWSADVEDSMNQESYEWIRMDSDFEWLCKIDINMPVYMYLSQLQQDRDIVAQYESIAYMASQTPDSMISSILVRTLMDKRYFHGIRTSAIKALAKCATEELGWIGYHHLQKSFQELFCFPNSPMTKPNDFSDRRSYNIQCAIPLAMSKIRDIQGSCPIFIKKFLFETLKYNDNNNNDFSDCHYIALLMEALADAIASSNSMAHENDENEEEYIVFQRAAIDEIDRYRRIDEWKSSYHNIYSITALKCKERLARAGVSNLNLLDFLQYTRESYFDMLRIQAFTSLIHLGVLKDDDVAEYFFYTLRNATSPYMRENMMRLLWRGLAGMVLDVPSSQPSNTSEQLNDGLIIEQESSATEARQAEIFKTHTLAGAFEALKKELSNRNLFKIAFWKAVTSPHNTFRELRDFLDLCKNLFPEITSHLVKLHYPRYWKVKHTIDDRGMSILTFAKRGRPRTELIVRKPLLSKEGISENQELPAKAELGPASSINPHGPRLILKKRPADQPAAGEASTAPPTEASPEPKRQKLTLKLKMPPMPAMPPPKAPSIKPPKKVSKKAKK
ncbi:MAG: hypothetical protein M1829_001013 [Trizodia sp. TS-e1964]|nr:MAG: hypothetical protein M1829_001013 [Trizodia sp. TS-e1964]